MEKNQIANYESRRVDFKNKATEVKNGPVSYGWISLGMGKGIKWVLWSSNVTFQRQEKQGDKWLTTEELHLAPKTLKEISWRIPSWLQEIDSKTERGGKYAKGQ